ncbi:MAG: hypothetical protein PHT44_04065 [Candidatus Portnoybacteria bacterium]|nr:hypothetical protein [Candidatus Portnoybacteria bacterium]MDD4982998.1 hypothetical protein [Candidatus Portnoybacteria bacterium]
MAIIISQNGQNAKKIDKSTFEKEGYLQNYIHQNPEAIPVYEIEEDKKLLVLVREFSTESGPIDALAIDKDGEIYIVETKLYKNPDKRTVVAQALDYGASLWRHLDDFDGFINTIDEEVRDKFGVGLKERVGGFFAIDDEQFNVLFETIKRNLSDGKLKFVILMDQMDERMKDLIIYVNQNSQFDIYAVEMEYYKYEQYEIMIPKIFGVEVKKDISVASASARKKWNEKSMMDDARQKFGPEEFKLFEKIYNFAKENTDQINFGTGAYATFSPVFNKISNKSIFTLGTDKRLSFNFEWFFRDNPKNAELFKTELEKVGFSFAEDYKETRPSVMIEVWKEKADGFIGAVKDLLK